MGREIVIQITKIGHFDFFYEVCKKGYFDSQTENILLWVVSSFRTKSISSSDQMCEEQFG